MKRILGSPALHFLLVGAVLFVLQSAAEGRRERVAPRMDRAPVVVRASDLADMREQYQETRSGEPDQSAYEYMIARFVDDELLYREALALGMDRGDMTVRYRLIEKMEYLGESQEGELEDEVVDRAIDMGLSRSDGMVRTAMIQKYSMLVRFARSVPPTEEQIVEYYQANTQRYVRPARVSFAHVFFSNQERGAPAAVQDAARVLEEIKSTDMTTEQAIAEGDVFLMGHEFARQSERAVGQLFGTSFAALVMGAEAGVWHGPMPSSFGSHLLFVEESTPEGILDLSDVRNQVVKGVEEELREEQLRLKLAELREVYDVIIEWDEFRQGGVEGNAG